MSICIVWVVMMLKVHFYRSITEAGEIVKSIKSLWFRLQQNCGDVQCNSSGNEGSTAALLPTLGVNESAAEAAPQSLHCLMQWVRRIVHDGCQHG